MIAIDFETADAPRGCEPAIARAVDACLRLEGVLGAAHVTIADNARLRELNRLTRSLDAATDVLSYPTVNYARGTARDNPEALRREYDPEFGAPFLGDIFISIERARAQAEEYGHGLVRELGFLAAHGALHLLGYDHIEEKDAPAMRAMEEKAMTEALLLRDGDDARLFELASAALKNAYAPYSNFKVGACVLADDGRAFTGCNIENASYGATICAERVAVTKAASEGVRKLVAIAIAGEKCPAWPCGMCRQVLREFAGDMRIIVGKAGEGWEETTLEALLPRSFGPESL